MTNETPDYQDADLALRVYEMRREPVMRESRKAIGGFLPKGYDDVLALTRADHPLNAAFRQTGSYWEMVYGFVKHGVVHPEFFMESNGEGMFLFAKIAPYLEAYRKDVSPTGFANSEWVSRETTRGRLLLEMFGARVKKLLEAR